MSDLEDKLSEAKQRIEELEADLEEAIDGRDRWEEQAAYFKAEAEFEMDERKAAETELEEVLGVNTELREELEEIGIQWDYAEEGSRLLDAVLLLNEGGFTVNKVSLDMRMEAKGCSRRMALYYYLEEVFLHHTGTYKSEANRISKILSGPNYHLGMDVGWGME